MSDPNWQTPVAVLQNEMKHIREQLEDIKQAQVQQAASMRKMEDLLTSVGAIRIALYVALPAFGMILGIKYQSVMSWFGFK